MSKKKSLVALWKEFGADNNKSIKDDFQNKPYENQTCVADYLDKGVVSLMSLDYGRDLFTGEKITDNYYIATDGEYTWANTLSYYVRKYNLRLPRDFEEKALANT